MLTSIFKAFLRLCKCKHIQSWEDFKTAYNGYCSDDEDKPEYLEVDNIMFYLALLVYPIIIITILYIAL